MNISNETITIRYQTSKEYCSCCSREFEIPELGEEREFDITLKNLLDWAEWIEKTDLDEEDISTVIREYINNTVRFYALNSNEDLVIIDGEINKVKNMVNKHFEKNVVK